MEKIINKMYFFVIDFFPFQCYTCFEVKIYGKIFKRTGVAQTFFL